MPKSEKRFARQHIYEPPPGFLLASPCSGIVHHLSVTIGVASADQWPACIETLDVSSPGRVHLLDSQRRWTPWSVFQDGWRAARPEGSPGRGARARERTATPARPAARGPRAHTSTVPRQRFHILCTLSPEFFSTFPHGTCSLSASRTCLALDGIHHRLGIAISSNPTPRRASNGAPDSGGTGLSPSPAATSKVTCPRTALEGPRKPQLANRDFRLELYPFRSPLLGASLLVSLPPLIDMLNFSGFPRRPQDRCTSRHVSESAHACTFATPRRRRRLLTKSDWVAERNDTLQSIGGADPREERVVAEPTARSSVANRGRGVNT